jgi:hypothetical protein
MNIKFTNLLNSSVFFTDLIKNDTFFNSLKDKFPEILADLTSSRNNPNCSCKNRVKAFLFSKINAEDKYFEELLSIEEIKNLIDSKKENISNEANHQAAMDEHFKKMQDMVYKNSGGKIFEINKDEKSWQDLCKKLENEKIAFKSFSVVEKEEKLIVYFI